MCGRYSLTLNPIQIQKWLNIEENFQKEDVDFQPRTEIFPAEKAPVIIYNQNQLQLKFFRWGFLPDFTSKPIINARAETAAQKKLFKESFTKKRCLIPATSFFEWKDKGEEKIKYNINLKDEKLLLMGGLFRSFTDKKGNSCQSYTIITTEPNNKLKDIHNRMPLIINKKDMDIWLDNNFRDISALEKLLTPFPGEKMKVQESRKSPQ